MASIQTAGSSLLKMGIDFLRKDYERNKLTIDLIRYIALWGHPLYFILCAYVLPQPYESAFLRFASPVAFIPILFYKHYPDSFKPWLNIYWYLWLTFSFPVIFTYLMLMNNMSGLWLVAETVMLLVFIIFIPNYLILTFLLFSGLFIAYQGYVYSTGTHLAITTEIIEYFVSIPVAILLGLVLSYTNNKGAMAEERNRILQSLAGSIAHEMRNPLGQIRQCLNGIQKLLPPFHHEKTAVSLNKISLDRIYQRVAHGQMAVKRGVQVIDMVLGEIREKPIDPASFTYLSASRITRKALDEYGYDSEDDRERVHLDADKSFTFRISETLFIFVIFNLLKNALYYLGSHTNSEIRIRLKTGTEYNYLFFRDTGPGITKEDLPHIFDSFHTKGKKGGTGLGLAYCKRVMKAFGGNITCDSVKGKYTEFTLAFPVVNDRELANYNAHVIANALPDFQGKRLLIVDDEPHYRMTLKKFLLPLQVKIDEAADGLEALEHIAGNYYDLIIMDLNMPMMNGYETVERLRRGEAGAKVDSTPIIAHSSEPPYIAQAMSEKVGMQALIAKPCNQAELINALRAVLLPKMPNKFKNVSFEKTQVLLVDDSALNRDLLAMSLTDAGLHLAVAGNGMEGWKMLQKKKFDLVITDIHMPEVDGLELTRMIRTSDELHLQQLPVIGLSGAAEEEKPARAAGMDEFRLKTENPDLLLISIRKLLASSPSKQPTDNKPSLVNLTASAKSFGLPLTEIKNLFRTFLDESRDIPAALHKALSENNFEKLRQEAHKLKGNAALFGAESVRQAAELLEQSCRTGQTERLEEQVEALQEALAELSKEPL